MSKSSVQRKSKAAPVSVPESHTASVEPFSLVPRQKQRAMHALIEEWRRSAAHGPVDTQVAQIAASLAARDSDVRIGIQNDGVQRTEIRGTVAALTGRAVADLAASAHRDALALVAVADFDDTWRHTLRFAGQHKLPIIYIVGTEESPRRSGADLRTIYAEFGIPVIRVDACDAIAAYRVATEAAYTARLGRGATILEAVTVHMGHGSLDSNEPLAVLETYMRRHGAWPQ